MIEHMQRRDFLKTVGLAGCAALMPDFGRIAHSAPLALPSDPVSLLKSLVDAALRAGAGYADARLIHLRNQVLQSRKDQVFSTNDFESAGVALRVYKGENWGYSASSELLGIQPAVMASIACAQAESLGAIMPLPLLDAGRIRDLRTTWTSPMEKDPFDISVKEKADFLLSISTAPTNTTGIAYSVANLFIVRRRMVYCNSLGAEIEQIHTITHPNFGVTAFDEKKGLIDSWNSTFEPRCTGYEIAASRDWRAEIEAASKDAIALRGAARLQTGEYDLVIAPSHLWQLVYESLAPHMDPNRLLGTDGGNPNELLCTPRDFGKPIFTSPLVSVDFDNTMPRGMATSLIDEQGHAASAGTLLEGGVLTALPGADESAGAEFPRSGWSARSAGWQAAPRFSMPNLVLRPSKEPRTLDDLVASTKRGLLLTGRGQVLMSPNKKWCRGNSQSASLIEDGKVTGSVRDFYYDASVLYLWNVLAELGGAPQAEMGGDLFPQDNNALWDTPFSISVPPARFTKIAVVSVPGAKR